MTLRPWLTSCVSIWLMPYAQQAHTPSASRAMINLMMSWRAVPSTSSGYGVGFTQQQRQQQIQQQRSTRLHAARKKSSTHCASPWATSTYAYNTMSYSKSSG